ncbi:MAG: flavodoxin FldA [Prevotellaceae bacterium]|jgi:flavodoxin I|nr:flavodoxin FldA [Prevotellaceae bacterium]
MSKIGIYYGSTTGNTKDVAVKIAEKLGITLADLHDVASGAVDFENYDVLLFGASTWGYGDLQDDWEDYKNKLKSVNLAGKKAALFGCGDSSAYSDSFCDALGKIYNIIKEKGCTIIGMVDTDGYSFDSSEAVIDNKFAGLPLDVNNEDNLTESRLDAWVEQLKREMQ